MACRDRSAQRHKTRPSRIKPLGDDVAACIVALTLDDPPGETTHWTGALMAKASGVSVWRLGTVRFSASGAPTDFSRIACGSSSSRTIRSLSTNWSFYNDAYAY
jgi:hypothetical protein